MKWSEVFEKLKNEETVCIPYEAWISLQLDKYIGNIPVYKIKVQYLNENGFVTEYLNSYEELKVLADKEVAFRKCSECDNLITDGFIFNRELDKEYCCVACMVKAMNREYGKTRWRFRQVNDIINEEDDTIKTNEYQYEILGNHVRMQVFNHMLEEQGIEFELEDSLDMLSEDEEHDDTLIHLVEETWIPYHMYYCPPLFDECDEMD